MLKQIRVQPPGGVAQLLPTEDVPAFWAARPLQTAQRIIAQRAQKMFLAELSGMKSNLADGVVIAKKKVGTAVFKTSSQLDITPFTGIMAHLNGPMMCLRVAV